MNLNSSKPAETGNPQLFALQVTREWLDREGGGQRIPTALMSILDATLTAVERGDPHPEKDSVTLTHLWQLSRGNRREVQASALRGADVDRWWTARAEHVRQVCADQGCEWVPHLVVRTGGGRNLPTQFAFELRHLLTSQPDARADHYEDQPGLLRYRIDAVKPALWLRLLVGRRPFPIHSWRGYVLLGTAVVNFVLIGLVWLGLFASWSAGKPITTAEIANVAFALLVSFGLWALTGPIRHLPTQRVTLAGASFLALKEHYGQLRTMRDEQSRFDSRVFSVVRHWGICTVCAGEVDVASGEKAFPDRLVGRCHDAPLEHVFSFDPVRLVGERLLPRP